VIGAHRIRHGRMPAMDETCKWEARPEFCFIEEINPSAVLEKIVALCCHIIPHHYHMDPIQDIQVLTPMHKGVVGTIHLNQVLQKQLQPEGPAIEYGGVAFKPGDKVMHMRNNYHKEVFNGDIGIVAGIDNRKKRLVVNFDGRLVDYEQMDLEELSLAYAISVHKSQGSEYPAIVVPLTMQHYVLLQRNLLYTAVTRGKFVVVMVGTRQALSIALKNDRPQQRLTRLSDRLRLNTQ
jgi:exodeoxyribonuclease V alpha subunit